MRIEEARLQSGISSRASFQRKQALGTWQALLTTA